MDKFREITIHGQEKNEKMTELKWKEKTMRRWNVAVEEEEGDVNKLADAFIKKFRNQLRVQCAESFNHFQGKMMGQKV